MPMPKPDNARETGGRLTGEDMVLYMESFADRFLNGKITFGVEVENISRGPDRTWLVKIRSLADGAIQSLQFDKLVLCSGVSNYN